MSGRAGHPAFMDAQVQKAFMKQPTAFLNKKGSEGRKMKSNRVVKAIGLGFKTPQDAKDGCYIDKKCPWAGNVSIRGKLLRGVVVSTKMNRTLVIRRDYLPLSKTVRFNVLSVVSEAQGSKKFSKY